MQQMCTALLHICTIMHLVEYFPGLQCVVVAVLCIQTLIRAIKGPRVMRHMNTEVAPFDGCGGAEACTQHAGCDCRRSSLLFYVAERDGGV